MTGSKVRVGISTVLVWIAAAVAAVGAAAQVLGDRAPWLAVVTAGLLAVNNAARAWQAAFLPDESTEVGTIEFQADDTSSN